MKFAVSAGSISMVAEGKLIRRWSEDKKEHAYYEHDICAVSHFVV